MNSTASSNKIMPDNFLFFSPSNSRAMYTSMPIAVSSKSSEMTVPKPSTSNSNYKSCFVNDCRQVVRGNQVTAMNFLIFARLCVLYFCNGDSVSTGPEKEIQ